ncbi:MAG: RAMP superfamily CRISPR-associated protein [Wenzhouxiangellaceae bacterium]|nr:RAMP superfamily CRISPR-associated protein [Wenzhouxiangellaceae bacterium]
MIPRKRYFHLARLVIENRTALSIVTGHPDRSFDTALVRDANGLPTLPGSAVAGVLRSLYWRLRAGDRPQVDRLFGHAGSDDAEPSAVQVSWGWIHAANDRPVFGLKLGEQRRAIDSDPILSAIGEDRFQRERVRIGHRGSAADEGKFDRAVLPAGYRFSLEISLDSDHAEDPEWPVLLGLVNQPGFRLGANTRAGLGAVRLVRCAQRVFDLEADEDAAAYRELGPDPGDTTLLAADDPAAVELPGVVAGELALEPDDFFRFGGDQAVIESGPEKPADLLPRLEPCVCWDDAGARLESAMLLVPGSSVKGALAHRFAYHFNALVGHFAEDCIGDDGEWDKSESCPGVRALFGYTAKSQSRAGCLLIDDASQSVARDQIRNLIHIAIDQFTGGVRRGALFSEDLVGGGGFPNIRLVLDTERLAEACKQEAVALETVCKALRRTLHDLCEGMLGLGASASRGHGFFSGRLTDSGLSAYLEEMEQRS